MAFSPRSSADLTDGRNLAAVADTLGGVSIFLLPDPRSLRSFERAVHVFMPHMGQRIDSLVFCTAAPSIVPSGPSASVDHPLLLTSSSGNRFPNGEKKRNSRKER